MSTSVVGEPGSTGYDRTGWFSSDYNVHDLNVTLEYSGIFWNILEIVFMLEIFLNVRNYYIAIFVAEPSFNLAWLCLVMVLSRL